MDITKDRQRARACGPRFSLDISQAFTTEWRLAPPTLTRRAREALGLLLLPDEEGGKPIRAVTYFNTVSTRLIA